MDDIVERLQGADVLGEAVKPLLKGHNVSSRFVALADQKAQHRLDLVVVTAKGLWMYKASAAGRDAGGQ